MNVSCLSMSARQNKNRVLTEIIWNVTNLDEVSKLTDPINAAFLISNVKLANTALFLSAWTALLSCYNAFN